jgi:tetratricopeptide (TPR) repeat protein
MTAACVLLFAATAWSDAGQMGLDAQMTPQQIADKIQQAAMQAAQTAGFPPDKAAKYIKEHLTDRILSDKNLDPSSPGGGVSPQQLAAAVQYIQTFPQLFTLLRESKADPKDQSVRQQLDALKDQQNGLIKESGPLGNDIHPDHDHDGDHDHDRGGDRGQAATPFGPALSNMMQGASDFGAGDYQGALAAYGAALQTDPKNADALSGSASAHFHLKDYDAAYHDAKAALALNQNDPNAQAVLHFSADRVSGGDDAAAAAASRTARPAASLAAAGAGSPGAAPAGKSLSAAAAQESAAALALRQADAAGAIGDAAAARAAIERGLALDPGNPQLLARRAVMEARSGEWVQSRADATAALQKDPKNLVLLRAKALAQLRTKDYAGAIATANEMLELDPSSADALALRGQAYGLLGKSDLMSADLAAAAALNPFYKDVAARAAAGTLVAPTDSDMLFLMPGEIAAGTGATAPSAGRTRSLGLMVAVAAAGGLLLAFGLLQTVFAPLKDKAAAALTQLTRTGPTLGEFETEPDAPAASATGLIRGQYELSREIGAGGMGRVYEGTDRSLGRRVAIKKMRDELRTDARERARFVAEAKTVAALHHPNIVDIYAIAEEAADVYLVFEYVDGKTVHELVYERGRLDPTSTARVVRASAEALEFAHARGVIHRDMKLSNVMVDSSGRVKVMDFGIARTAKDAMSRYSMTKTVIGTPPYMAPEQEQGQVRRESDVYALAVCAYEMLTGSLPFAGVGAGMALNKINMAYTPPSRREAGLPASLDDVFAHAFQPDPEKRTRSPREFAAALENALPSAARA